MGLLKHKVIFLTGGSSGIGLECAKKYREQQARVVIVSNDQSSLTEAINVLKGDEEDAVFCDVTDGPSVKSAIGKTIEKYGKIDVIHNNAGIAAPAKALHETNDAEWATVFDINVKGILHTTRYGFDTLRETRGCIINTSSLVGKIGQHNHAAYAATKGAVDALTKSMALDYAPHHIRVNAVAPAGVWTSMLRKWAAEQPEPAEMATYLDQIHPLGYCPEGDVIGDACVFLASPMAAFITGCILPVSGGAELGYRALLK